MRRYAESPFFDGSGIADFSVNFDSAGSAGAEPTAVNGFGNPVVERRFRSHENLSQIFAVIALYLLIGDMDHWHGILSLLFGWEHDCSVYSAEQRLLSGCQSRYTYESCVGGNKAVSLRPL